MSNLDRLAEVMEKDKAEEILRLTENFDKYIKKFKNSLNPLLAPIGFEAKIGLIFDEIKKD